MDYRATTLLRKATLGACLCLLVAAPTFATDGEDEPGCCHVAGLGFETSEPGSFLDLSSGKEIFRAATLLEAEANGLASVSNPFPDRAIRVQVRSLTADANSQTVALELAPLDRADFALQEGAVHLLATSNAIFRIEVQGASADARELEVTNLRTGRNPRTNKASGSNKSGGGTGYSVTRCQSDWTLTCKVSETPGCAALGPFTHPGRIVQDYITIGGRPILLITDVYWNLNTPNGDYKTKAPGGLTADWEHSVGYCPDEVTNSIGHTYTVTR